MKIFLKNSSKKGQAGADSALIQLFYIVMGVIVLLTFVKLIFTFLNLDSNSNDDIAKSNANSITQFQQFSKSEKYKDYNDCYTLLKISNIETYQHYNKKENNFIIILSEDGTYIEKRPEDPEEYYETLDLTSKKPDFEYGTTTKLLKDITDQGGIFGLDTTLFGYGSADSQIYFSDVKYIVLDSTIFEQSNFVEENINKLMDTLENENKFKITTISKSDSSFSDLNEIETFYSKYLVYSHFENALFISNGISSDLLINSKLCSYSSYKYDLIYKEYQEDHGTNIPYTKYDVFFQLYINDDLSEYNFAWQSQPLCFQNNKKLNCDDILTKLSPDLNINDYYDFIQSIEEFSAELIKTMPVDTDLVLKHSFKPLDLSTIIERKKEHFISVKEGEVLLRLGEFSTVDELKEFEHDNFIDIDNWEMNKIINHCDEDICDKVLIKNNKAYFYLKRDRLKYRFTKFDESYIKKDRIETRSGEDYENYNYYFNGELININDISVHNHDSKDYFVIKELLMMDGNIQELYDVILTQRQFSDIVGDKK
jgi:hypothetical protein